MTATGTASASAPAAALGHVVRHATRSRRRRALVVVLALALVVLAAGVLGLSLGDYAIAPQDVLAALTGAGDSGQRFVILYLRLPRVLAGAMVGLAFGVAGAVFQSVLRNPLASPDVIGITSGASAGAVAALLVGGASGIVVSGSAFGGALLVAAVIAVLGRERAFSGRRFVLVGIALAFLLRAVIDYLLTRADVRDAQTALAWLVGSIGTPTWSDLGLAAACIGVPLALLAPFARRMRVLQLGEDLALGLGSRPALTRGAVVVLAVALAAAGTALAGPIVFVPFVAGPIARRLSRDGGPSLVASGLVGAALVLVADAIAQHAIPGVAVPVGVVTGIVGAPYLVYLVSRSPRSAA